MVRGNWQKRVESAEARRKEAKQRKQRTGDKREWKGWVHDFLSTLDRHESTLRKNGRPWVLEVWTTTLSSDSPSVLDLLVDDHRNKGRPRNNSVESEAASRKGRGRSNSTSEKSSGKKKAHPRSKEIVADAAPETELLTLCRAHFFSGSCEAVSNKKRGCRNAHFSKKLMPALSMMVDDSLSLESAALAAAEIVPEDEETGNPGGMEMVYHYSIRLDGGMGDQKPISDQCLESFTRLGIPLSSIVYVVLNKGLVFDRYREGMCVSDRGLLTAAVGAEVLNRQRLSIGSETDHGESPLLFDLPGNILERILTFLPDESVASSAQVCKSWHREIGLNPTPNLWSHLLKRRGWSCFPGYEDSVGQLRATFLEHYCALRDCTDMKKALDAIGKRHTVTEIQFCYQDFSKHKFVPSASSSCVSLKYWSPRQVLVAYSPECSLRLYEATKTPDFGELRCKELAYMIVDPYRRTKRRTCSMISMDLDDDIIGCLCHVLADNVDAEAYILVFTTRDEFLLSENSAATHRSHEAGMQIVDIGEAVLNYMLTSESADHRTLQVLDFLMDGEIGDVEILASRSIVSCGHGRFMVEVSIAIPVCELDAEWDGDDDTRLVDRKLVLFSSSANAIVWVGSSSPSSDDPRPREEEMVLRTSRLGSVCLVAIFSPVDRVLQVMEIGRQGDVQILPIDEDGTRTEIDATLSNRSGRWRLRRSFTHELVVTPTDVIVAEIMEEFAENDQVLDYQAMLSFYRIFSTNDDDKLDHAPSILVLSGKLVISTLTVVRENHIVAICSGPVESDAPDAGGHWDRRRAVVLVVIHVQTREEIGRVELAHGSHLSNHLPLMDSGTNTVCTALAGMGVVLTGSDVRDLLRTSIHVVDDGNHKPSSARKKKKGSARKKSGKKDGFARGMTMRG